MRSRLASPVILCAALALLLWGCVPLTAGYLSIPVESRDRRSRRAAEVSVPLAELRARMPGFDVGAVAFYAGGRTPLPHRLADQDGDGEPDAAVVVLSVAGNGSTRLVAVCPGPRARGTVPEGVADEDVVLRFDRAHQ